MKKSTIISEIEEKTNFSYKDIENVVNRTLDIIIDSLKSGVQVSLYGFGSFKIYKKKAKEVYIPGTKQKVQLEEKYAVKFIPSKKLKTLVEDSEL